MAEVTPGADALVTPDAPEAATPAPEQVSTAEPVTDVPEGGEQPEQTPERTFTQKELDAIVQKRIAKESKRAERLGEERARREAAERELERIRTERNPQPQGKQGAPRPEDFGGNYEKYVVELAKHELRQELEQGQRETAAQTAHRQQLERAQSMREKIAAVSDEFPDIEEVIHGDVPFTQPMVAFFEDQESPGKLIYHLAQNVKEAARIAQLSPAGQFRELIKLEAKLAAPPTPTKTGAPIVPAGAKATVQKDPEDMTYAEFCAYRKRQIAQRGGRSF
jgi:hypothetical protein